MVDAVPKLWSKNSKIIDKLKMPNLPQAFVYEGGVMYFYGVLCSPVAQILTFHAYFSIQYKTIMVFLIYHRFAGQMVPPPGIMPKESTRATT